jgi:hypothetical protein
VVRIDLDGGGRTRRPPRGLAPREGERDDRNTTFWGKSQFGHDELGEAASRTEGGLSGAASHIS